MSSFFYRYSDYLQAIYSVLSNLAIVAFVLVLGWFLVKLVYRKSKLLDLYQWIYLAGCAGIYLGLIAYFIGG